MGDTTTEIWPTFLIIGAAKAGTTSLWTYLRQHPQVFMSAVNEINYFAYDGKKTRSFSGHNVFNEFPVKTRAEYLELFKEASGAMAVGDVSPLYLESTLPTTHSTRIGAPRWVAGSSPSLAWRRRLRCFPAWPA